MDGVLRLMISASQRKSTDDSKNEIGASLADSSSDTTTIVS
jgi:hypothetical protein